MSHLKLRIFLYKFVYTFKNLPICIQITCTGNDNLNMLIKSHAKPTDKY